MKKTLIVLFATAFSLGTTYAQPPAVWVNNKTDWMKIGETSLDLSQNRQTIAVSGANTYAAVKFKVIGSDVEIRDLNAYYDNGEMDNVKISNHISAGQESKAYALPSIDKTLAKIEVMYNADVSKGSGKTKLEVWAAKVTYTEEELARMKERRETDKEKEAYHNNDRIRETQHSDNVSDRDRNNRPAWVKLGDKRVDFKTDRDEISLPGGQRYNFIKFRVTEAPINITDMIVYYDNDEKQNVTVKSSFNAGEESKTVNLDGRDRDIKKIVFIYRTLENRKDERANVEVWGMKAYKDVDNTKMNEKMDRGDDKMNRDKNAVKVDDGKGPAGKPAVMVSDKVGWHKIGETRVDFKREEDGISPVASDRFSSIKIKITDGDIMLQDMKVYYEDGTMQDVSIRASFKEGTESRVIDLKGGESSLKKITFMYKTMPNSSKDKAHVELWGNKTNIVK